MSWWRESSLYRIAFEEGRAEGRAEGRYDVARRALLRVGTRLLGPADIDTVTTVNRVSDLELLELLVLGVADATSWQEFLADIPSR